MTRYIALILCTILLLPTLAVAQSRQIPGPPQQRPIILSNATVHPVNRDTIGRGWIIFADGRITALGEMPLPPEGERPDDYDLIDATDLHVYPGLIANNTQVGLQETGSVRETIDHTERGEFTPEVRAAVAVNPDSELFPVARHNGILLGGVFPRGGLVSGRAAVVRFDGWTWEDMAVDDDLGLVINWPRTEPINAWWMDRSDEQQRREIAEQLEQIDDYFDDAEAYFAARDNDPTVKTDQRFEGMRSTIGGESPALIRASTSGQIESAVAFALRRGLNPVIVGGHDAADVVDLLVEHTVPVIIDGLHRLPGNRHDPYDTPFALPRKLHEAGVRFCIASGAEPAHERNLNHNAATAAAYGLPKQQALRAVTLSAAEILGIADDYGSLEPGKSATLIVTTGDPLEIMTDTLIAYIDGRRVDLGNRQVSLYQKYQEKYRQLGLLDGEND